jgi:protein TonB
MFSVLLESRAQRARRTGGIALSLVSHVAMIGLVTAATLPRPEKTKEPPVTIIHFNPPPVRPVPVVPEQPVKSPARAVVPTLATRTIEYPAIVPKALPPIDFAAAPIVDPSTVDIVAPGDRRARSMAIGIVTPGSSGDENAGTWNGSEALMHLTSTARPRYPETLRAAGISGQVLIRFLVDTTGRVDISSVTVLQSTHELFTQAVRAALPALRFKPSEVNGRRVPALAEMPFEFQIRP